MLTLGFPVYQYINWMNHSMQKDELEEAPVKIPRVVLSKLFNFSEHADNIVWEPFRSGIDIHRLYGGNDRQPAAALIRYQPGAHLPRHEHIGVEHILVLSGSQRDEFGVYNEGTFIINPPGSAHSVVSDSGCIVLVIWHAPIQFSEITQ